MSSSAPENPFVACTSASLSPIPSSSSCADVENERRSHWVPDEEVNNCILCKTIFTVTKWKHHCRSCGKVYCSECSASRIRLPELGYTEKVRVCDDCFFARTSSHTRSLQEDLDVQDKINVNLKKALEEKTKIVDNFRTFLLQIESLLDTNLNQNNQICYNNDESFETVMKNSEEGIKQLILSLNYKEKINQDLSNRVNKLSIEFREKNLEINNLKEKILNYENEILSLRNIANEKDALFNLAQEQKRSLQEQVKQIEGLKQRCFILECEDKDRRGNISKISTAYDYYNESSIYSRSRNIETSNPSNSIDSNFVIAYTLADGLDEPMNESRIINRRFSFMRRTYRKCCCCCSRRRRSSRN